MGLVGCSSFDTRGTKPGTTTSKGGGYYKDDGPGDNPPANLAEIPDAVPRTEPVVRGTMKPYTAMGRNYVPMNDARGFRQAGLASWYGRRYHGKATASGEPYDMYAMSAAHPTLPIPSYVLVTNPANGRSVVVRINDRGPFHDERVIDLSYTAAWKLDILKGVTPVELELLDPSAVPATVVATPLAPLPAATDTGSGTYLQLGAFSSPRGAEELVQRVNQRMGSTLPGVQQLNANGLIKVQVGPFANANGADLVAGNLERELGIQPFKVYR